MTELRAHLIWLALTVKGSPPASLVILTVYLNAAGLRTFFFLHTCITVNGLQFPHCTAPDSQPVKEGAFPPPGGCRRQLDRLTPGFARRRQRPSEFDVYSQETTEKENCLGLNCVSSITVCKVKAGI